VIEPFVVSVEDGVLDDLAERLGSVRLAPIVSKDDAGFGLRTGQLETLVDYWRDGFDWRAQEAELNR
jgi:epoxide hydrolase